MSTLEQVKHSLTNILLVLQSLSLQQREALVRFERCNVDPTQQNLSQVINQATEQQMEQLVQSSQYENDAARGQLPPCLGSLSKNQLSAFGCIFRLVLLQETLFRFTREEILVLLDICRMPSFPADLQLRCLQQFQQFLASILPETLRSIHETVREEEKQGREASQVIFQLLESYQDQAVLANPLAQLLSTDETTMLHIQEFLPALQPLQLIQLVRLMQMDNQWHIIEIRQLLSRDNSGWMGLQGIIDDGDLPMDEEGSAESAESFTMTIIDQPPEKTVYKRCLKPNPTVIVKSRSNPNLLPGETLCIVPLLYRFDVNQQVNFLTGNTPVSISIGSAAVFKRLKITKTSHQLDDTLFFLRFELRKTDGNKQSEPIAHVQTKPFTVVSHSTLLSKAAQITLPTVSEVVPSAGSTEGGSRVVILGTNFEDSPRLVVKFDNIPVIPEFHGPGTLICITPRHFPAQVVVSVANNSKEFGKSTALFTFEDTSSTDPSVGQLVHQSTDNFTQTDLDNLFGNLSDIGLTEQLLASGFSPFEMIHYAAAFGKQDIVEKLLYSGKVSANCLDRFGNNGLYWALRFGHNTLITPFVRAGIDMNHQNINGETLLHLAASISPQLVANLIYLGAWVNTSDYEGQSALHVAAVNGNVDILKVLLRCGCFLNSQDNEGDTALHYAIREGKIDIVNALVAEGISLNLQNEDGETALHTAISAGDISIIQILLQTKKCSVNLQDNTGASSLFLAAECGLNAKWVEQLINSGSDVHQTDATGKSPLEAAKMANTQESLINLLMSHGAKYSQESTDSMNVLSNMSSPLLSV